MTARSLFAKAQLKEINISHFVTAYTYVFRTAYSKDASNQMRKEQNDFYWLDETRGGAWWAWTLRLTPRHLSPSQ